MSNVQECIDLYLTDGHVSDLWFRAMLKLHAELARLAAREGTSMTHETQVALRAHIDADKQRRSR